MDDFKTSFGGSYDHLEKIKAQEIEEQARQRKEEEDYQAELQKKIEIVKCFLIKKILRTLPRHVNAESLILLEKRLRLLQESFEELTESDLSQDVDFLEELSLNWSELLDHFFPLSLSKNRMIQRVKEFLEEMHSFSFSNKGYSLGYYLSEFAGLEWIPFPYMEILKTLHEEYVESPEESHLERWLNEIDEIIEGE